MGITKITTRNRHVSSNNPTKHDSEIGYNSTIDINRHDDTHCFGKNFRIVSSAEQVWSATELLDKLANTNNVKILTAATAMIDEYGTLFIAIFGQGLNFTKKMDKGLINTNKCR